MTHDGHISIGRGWWAELSVHCGEYRCTRCLNVVWNDVWGKLAAALRGAAAARLSEIQNVCVAVGIRQRGGG